MWLKILYFNIYLFIELEKLFFKPSVWPSGQYSCLFPGARRVLRSGCSIVRKFWINTYAFRKIDKIILYGKKVSLLFYEYFFLLLVNKFVLLSYEKSMFVASPRVFSEVYRIAKYSKFCLNLTLSWEIKCIHKHP